MVAFSFTFPALDGHRYPGFLDDSFISLRYSWNLAHGDGLVWNPGERVEGYSNLLMVLVMALPALVLSKTGTVIAVQLLGALFLLGAGFYCSRIARWIFRDLGEPARTVLELVAFALPALYYPLAFLSLGGMETGLLALLLFAALDRVLSENSGRLDFFLAFQLGLAFLTRPDALVFVAIILGYRIWTARRGGVRLHRLLVEGGVVLGIVALSEGFRLAYYGEWVPNTYLLKMAGIPLGVRLFNGGLFILPLLGLLAIPLVLATVGILRRPSRETTLLLLLVLSSLVLTVWVGGDFLPHGRFSAPLVPLLLLLAVRGVQGWSHPIVLSRHLVGWALAALLLLANLPHLGEMSFLQTPYGKEWNIRNTNTALFLKEVCGPEATVAVTWAGAIPFWSGFKGIDLLGRCDPVVAKKAPLFKKDRGGLELLYTPGHNRCDLWYSVARRYPTFLQTMSCGPNQEEDIGPEAVRFYRWVRFPGIGFYDEILLRKNSSAVNWERVEGVLRQGRFP